MTRKKKRYKRGTNKALQELRSLIEHVIAEASPTEALKIIFTPENVEAATRGWAQGMRK